MPYASKAQSRFLHSQHPEVASKWDKEYPNQKGLPERKKSPRYRAMESVRARLMKK